MTKPVRGEAISFNEAKRRIIKRKMSTIKRSKNDKGVVTSKRVEPSEKEIIEMAKLAGMEVKGNIKEKDALTYLVAAQNVSKNLSRLGIKQGVKVTAKDIEKAEEGNE